MKKTSNRSSLLKLEDPILRSRALLYLLSDKLSREIEGNMPTAQGGAIAAGIVSLGHDAAHSLGAGWELAWKGGES